MQIPLMFELTGKNVLVVGGDLVAYLKTVKFLEFGANISVVSKTYCKYFEKLDKISKHTETLKHIDLNTSHFTNKDIVIIATNNKYLNKKIYDYCDDNKILSISIDHSSPSDFTVMESAKEQGLTIAVSTIANNPPFESEIIKSFFASLDDDVIKRLNMLIDEQRILRKLQYRDNLRTSTNQNS